jgi:hypothetical protein
VVCAAHGERATASLPPARTRTRARARLPHAAAPHTQGPVSTRRARHVSQRVLLSTCPCVPAVLWRSCAALCLRVCVCLCLCVGGGAWRVRARMTALTVPCTAVGGVDRA